MKSLQNYTVKSFCDILSKKTPVPGGGCASALVGALGVGLISMAIHYSLGKGKSRQVEARLKSILKKVERIRKQLIQLIDLDAQAYWKVVQTRKIGGSQKERALEEATKVPWKVSQLCYEAVKLTPEVVEFGNPLLLSDMEAAIEMLWASYQAAIANVRINQEK